MKRDVFKFLTFIIANLTLVSLLAVDYSPEEKYKIAFALKNAYAISKKQADRAGYPVDQNMQNLKKEFENARKAVTGSQLERLDSYFYSGPYIEKKMFFTPRDVYVLAKDLKDQLKTIKTIIESKPLSDRSIYNNTVASLEAVYQDQKKFLSPQEQTRLYKE